MCVFAVRTCFLHLAEALAYHRDTEVPLRAIIAMLKAGERCNAEAELVGKGISMWHTYSRGISIHWGFSNGDISDSHQE